MTQHFTRLRTQVILDRLAALAFFIVVALCGTHASHAASDELLGKTSDENSTAEALRLFVVPLTSEELAELAVVWQDRLSDSMEDYVLLTDQIGRAEPEQASEMRLRITDLAAESARYSKNYQVVLEAWETKGGNPDDILVHQTYLTAIGSAAISSTDLKTIFSLVKDWLFSPEGGLGMALQGGVFVVALIILLFVSRMVRKLAARGLSRIPTLSRLLQTFILTVVYWLTMGLGVLVALSLLGVNVTPLFAVFGGLSFILGFALQDTLGNLASGLMIMVLKPFDTGDYIEISGASGTVDSMSIVSTQIRTFDNQFIVVPNSKIWGDVITNVSAAKTRRVDLVFGIAYSDNATHAIEVLKAEVAADPRCLLDPAPEIFVGELGDSSVNVFCRPWVTTDDYWDVYWGLTGSVKEKFDQEGISIPFPQRDVHLFPVKNKD